jgi:hypothetical protein
MMACCIQIKKGRLSMSYGLSLTQSKFSPRWAILSLEISAQHDLKNARLLNKSLSLRRRAPRAIFRFSIAFCLGIAATLGWQSYGDVAKEMIANWSEQLGWLAPAPDAHASGIIAPTAVVAPSPDVEEQAAEQDVVISEPKSPAAPTPSQAVGPQSDLEMLLFPPTGTRWNH